MTTATGQFQHLRVSLSPFLHPSATSATSKFILRLLSGAGLLLLYISIGLACLWFGSGSSAPLLISAGLIVLYATTLWRTARREGSAFTPVTAFFTFAVMHAISGYYSIAPTATYLLRPRAGMYDVFEQAFFIVSIGLSSMMMGYMLTGHRRQYPIELRLTRYLQQLEFKRLERRAYVFLFVAVSALAYVYWIFGEVPLLTPERTTFRYLYHFQSDYLPLASVYNRCRETLQTITPVFALAMVRFGWRPLRIAAFLLGSVSLLTMVQRAPLLSLFFTLAIVLLGRKHWKLVITFMAVILVAYLASHYFLFNWGVHSASASVPDVYQSALPEVRDLAWVLSSRQPLLWGSTFLHALFPLPGFVTEFQRRISLRTVTLEAVGIPIEAPHGGLRILFAGECYLNFGIPGVVILCFGYGWLCARAARIFSALQSPRPQDLAASFVVSSLWVLLSFWVYLCGLVVAGPIKFEALVLCLLCVPLRFRYRRENGLPRVGGA